MVKRTERGWAGHFEGANDCKFRRNTLLQKDDTYVVVSTVGLWVTSKGKYELISGTRYFETMAFFSDKNDHRYHDADVSNEIYFNSNWHIDELDADDKANLMHEAVVEELILRLESGSLKQA